MLDEQSRHIAHIVGVVEVRRIDGRIKGCIKGRIDDASALHGRIQRLRVAQGVSSAAIDSFSVSCVIGFCSSG